MPMALARWTERVKGPLQKLGEHRGVLLCFMLGLNALAFPYAGFIHDAMLYSAQVYNRVEAGSFANDLFFRYGSQDDYSPFSLLLTPFVKVIGLSWTFFLAYIACKTLELWGFIRLVTVLVKDRALAAGCLLLLAAFIIGPGPYGPLALNEPFLTARLPAYGLVLLGLARLLDGRPVSGLALLSLAMLIHPLMGFPGLAVGLLWTALEYLPRRLFWILTAVGAVVLAVVLGYQPLGHRIFGEMDATWFDEVGRFNPITFPTRWPASDWRFPLVSLFIVVGWVALWGRERPREARLLVSVVVVALGGLAACITAEWAQYALLFQAQTYRALWLPECFCIPLGLLIVSQLWCRGGLVPRIAAVAIVQAVIGVFQYDPVEAILYAGAFVTALIVCRGLARTARRPDWLQVTVLVTLVAGYVLWTVCKLAVVYAYREVILTHREAFDIWQVSLAALGPFVWVAAGLAAAAWLSRFRSLTQALVPAALALTVALTAFLLPASAYYHNHWQADYQDVAFVARFLEGRREPGSMPTVYYSTYRIDRIWLDLHANGYFNVFQTAGVIFSKDSAREGARRAQLAKRFEVSRFRREQILSPNAYRYSANALFQLTLDSAPPTRADLVRLCSDRALDYAIIREAFDGLYTATNGQVYVYDCARIRAAFGSNNAPESPALANEHAVAGSPGHPRYQSPQGP